MVKIYVIKIAQPTFDGEEARLRVWEVNDNEKGRIEANGLVTIHPDATVIIGQKCLVVTQKTYIAYPESEGGQS